MKDLITKGRIFYVVPTGNLVRSYGSDAREGVVTKVGRKYIYVKIDGVYYGGEEGVRFDKNTLRGEQGCNSNWIAYCSMQEIEDMREKKRLHSELREFFDWRGKSHKLTLKQLREIKAIIDEEEFSCTQQKSGLTK